MNKKQQKALEEAAKTLGIEIKVNSNETQQDIIREADSVMMYFDLQGKKFTKIECLNCHRFFAYSYTSDSIKCCSIECMIERLKRIGLKWDPAAPLERRWGRYAPAIVPPDALEILDKILEASHPSNSKENQENGTPTRTTADDLLDFIHHLPDA